MTIYNEKDGKTLLTGATDREGDPITVYDLEGVSMVGVTTPTLVKTIAGVADIYCTEAGAVTVDLLDPGPAPADGGTATYATLSFRLWDGSDVGAAATATIELLGEAVPAAGPYDPAGLVAWWDAESYAGGDWSDAVSGRVAAVVGTPVAGTPPGGSAAQSLAIGAGAGFTCADLAGLPVGTADRTVMLAACLTGGFGYAGFGYGANAAGQAFTLSIDNQGELAVDLAASRIGLGIHPGSAWFVLTARVSSGTLSIFLGSAKVHTGAFTGNTGADLINVCRTFSGNTTLGEIGDCLVWGRALSDAEIATAAAAANARFTGAAAPGAPGVPAASNVTAGGFDFGGTVPGTHGTVFWAVTRGTGALTADEVVSGAGAVAGGIAAIDGAGGWSASLAGAPASTDHRVHAVFCDLVGGRSAVAASATITTGGVAAPAPGLSAPAGTADSSGNATLTAATDSANGDAVLGALPAAAATPSRAQLRAGTDGSGNPIATAAIGPVASTALAATVAGLAPGASYRTVAQQDNSEGTASAVAVQAGTWTVPAVATTTRQQVEGLRTGVTPVGRTAVTAMKGLGALPAGTSLGSDGNMALVSLTSDNVTLDNFDFTNAKLNTNGRKGWTLSQCHFEYTVAPTGILPQLGIKSGSDGGTARYCNFRGLNGSSNNDKQLILHEFSGSGLAASCAANVTLEHLHIDRYSNDGVHTAGGGLTFQWNYIGPGATINVDILGVYSGNPGDYAAGDHVYFLVGGIEYLARATSTPTGAPVKDTSGASHNGWQCPAQGPHHDMLNPRAGIGAGVTHTIRYNYFRDYCLGPDGARAYLVNNWLRLVRNSGRVEPMGRFDIHENLNDRGNTLPSSPVQLAGGTNVTGPVNVWDNWCGQKGGGNAGWWAGGAGLIGTWSNNVDLQTGVAIPRP